MIAADSLAIINHTHLPALLVVGLAIFFGTVGANIFQKLRIPQVVGYIFIGIIVGRSGLNLIDEEAIRSLRHFNFFALGVIGFMIGGELHLDLFKKYGRHFFVILLSEGMGAFFFVGGAVFVLVWLLLHDFNTALSLGLLLGAISSATAPAATVDVLWEYKTRGILTTTVFAIVALDDGLALVLYGIASTIAGVLLGQTTGSGYFAIISHTLYELLGAVVLGAGSGFLLSWILHRPYNREKSLTFVIGSLALIIGLTLILKVDLILSTMALGMTLANLIPRRSNIAFQMVESIAPPIYVLFFVVVGAGLHIAGMAAWIWYIAIVYVVARTLGKMIGAYLGARWTGAAQPVRKYLGYCLFSQAGVAVGLAILSGNIFGGDIGNSIVMIITATTFLVQIIGPPCVKYAVKRAGEVGLNVTEEDLMRAYKAGQMVSRETPAFTIRTPLAQILQTIADTDAMVYPVVDPQGRLAGLISILELRQSLADAQLAQWVVAYDLMLPPPDNIEENTPLDKAITTMKQQNLECLPVFAEAEDHRFLGLLELRKVNRQLSQEILRRRQASEA